MNVTKECLNEISSAKNTNIKERRLEKKLDDIKKQ